jgi:hypothetical protein
MVFKTSQMLLLTSLAKAREKEKVRRMALPSALYTKRRVCLHAAVDRIIAIGRQTADPPDRTATAIPRIEPDAAVHRIADRTASWPAPTATRRVSRTARRGRREQPRGAARKCPPGPHNFNRIGVLFNTKYFILDNNGY